jgi:glycolate oxidase FAD binding subunit
MVRPESEAALVAVVREGAPVHAIGSGTKLHHGPAPDPGARAVCLRALDRITHYEPGDLVVCVQAGARLADVQAELARHGQWLPLDPPYADATIGGVLATNSSGPRRLAYGTARDLLLGLRVVESDGAITRCGGRVVKNVTGYDLHKLHVGAFGSLGILLEANFKVRPRPEEAALFVRSCASSAEAHRLLLEIFASGLRPAALEVLGRRAFVAAEGTRPFVDRHARALRDRGFEPAEPGSLAVEPRRDGVRVRWGARPLDLPELLPPVEAVQIHAGTGIARLELEPADDLAARIAEWNRQAEALGGYAVTESAPLDWEGRARLPWGPSPDPLMGAIRRSKDPEGRLNPGRVRV